MIWFWSSISLARFLFILGRDMAEIHFPIFWARNWAVVRFGVCYIDLFSMFFCSTCDMLWLTIFCVSSSPLLPSLHRCVFDSFVLLLQNSYCFLCLLVTHRLDRLTCGLLIIAKDKVTASCLNKRFFNHRMHKVYLARVSGDFGECVCF